MTQQNRSDTFGQSYAEYSRQYGNLYAVGYAVAESEVRGAFSHLASSVRKAFARRTDNQPRREAAMAPARRKTAVEA